MNLLAEMNEKDCKMNGEHHDRCKQVVRADQEGILQHGLRGVGHDRGQREDVHQDDRIEDGGSDHERQEKRPEDSRRARRMRAEVVEDVAVGRKQDADGGEDEPQLGCLPEILLEGAEKHGDDVLLLAADDLDADIVKRGSRGADREDRQRTDEPQKIEQAGLAERQDELAEFAVI